MRSKASAAAPPRSRASSCATLGLSHVAPAPEARSTGLLALLWQRRWITLALTARHLSLTGVAVLAAVFVGLPLGIAASRRPRLAGLALSSAGVLQTIPSIALLAFMLPLFGIGVAPAIAALFLYGLLPILRNTVAGLRSVDAQLLEVGRGLGMRARDLLWRVELPLAAPVILAGIRTAAVISVGTATLAALHRRRRPRRPDRHRADRDRHQPGAERRAAGGAAGARRRRRRWAAWSGGRRRAGCAWARVETHLFLTTESTEATEVVSPPWPLCSLW